MIQAMLGMCGASPELVRWTTLSTFNGHVIAPDEWWSHWIDINDSEVQHLDEVHDSNSVWPCVTCRDACRTNIDNSDLLLCQGHTSLWRSKQAI